MTETELLEKKIKKHIYGKLQSILITFPPGLSETALAEVQTILNEPWFAKPFAGECTLSGNQIYIQKIQMVTAIELLLRAQCITDIRLIIFAGHASGKKLFEKKCREIPWNYYIHSAMALKIKVTSIASRAFHETALKQILAEILSEQQAHLVSGEDANETTCIYADLYKDRLTVSISLAGTPLYKRGYRGTLRASAPLREDAAACCLQEVLRYSGNTPDTVIIPFSGTGTFAFEFLQYQRQLSTALLGRDYALQSMPLFKPNHFHFLIKQAQKKCLSMATSPTIICIDNHPDANQALLDNIKQFNHAITIHDIEPITVIQKNEDFFAMDFDPLRKDQHLGHVLLPLNPPYGIRLGKSNHTVNLYQQIAIKINEFATNHTLQTISGFILCPSESSWSIFCKTLLYTKMETYHFTQGGLDIRVCQWFYDKSSTPPQNKL